MVKGPLTALHFDQAEFAFAQRESAATEAGIVPQATIWQRRFRLASRSMTVRFLI
jgi:hypothetical protein